jgi:DNA-binding CsgD family transcriptional regulator
LPHDATGALPEDLLTPREHEVLRLILAAQTNSEIADQLKLSPDTVKTHLRQICVKLGARNRVDIAMKTLKLGLVDLDELNDPGPRGLYRLTPREEDVLDLLKRGLLASAIGEQLGIATTSVYNVERSIRKKWGVDSREELLARARTYRRPRCRKPSTR